MKVLQDVKRNGLGNHNSVPVTEACNAEGGVTRATRTPKSGVLSNLSIGALSTLQSAALSVIVIIKLRLIFGAIVILEESIPGQEVCAFQDVLSY